MAFCSPLVGVPCGRELPPVQGPFPLPRRDGLRRQGRVGGVQGMLGGEEGQGQGSHGQGGAAAREGRVVDTHAAVEGRKCGPLQRPASHDRSYFCSAPPPLSGAHFSLIVSNKVQK
eukprot:Hpha_TRINITY_DN10805_c0_g1::TRINITY_DN10805_c0_g1_i1::g.23039::m.23039